MKTFGLRFLRCFLLLGAMCSVAVAGTHVGLLAWLDLGSGFAMLVVREFTKP